MLGRWWRRWRCCRSWPEWPRSRRPRPTARLATKPARIADDYWEFYLRENPEVATALGEYRYNARLTDYSLAHVNVLRTQSADLLARAQAIDTAGLSEMDRLDQQLLVRTLSDQLESIRLKNYEMPIDQMNGVHLALPQIATIAPFDSVAHYRDYIARLNAIPVAINQVIQRSRAGLKDGLVQPRFLLEKTVIQWRPWPTRREPPIPSLNRWPDPGSFRRPIASNSASRYRRSRWEGPPGIRQAQDVHRQ